MRLNSDHHEVILNLAEKHPQIITNKFKGPLGNNLSKSLWQLLINQLNGLGYGVLTENEYKRRLIDWKSKTKAKAAEIDKSKRRTGGGQSTSTVLSQHEERLLSLMGISAVRGNEEVQEFGVGEVELPEKKQTQICEKKKLSRSSNIPVGTLQFASNISEENLNQASTTSSANWESYTVSPTFELVDFVPSVENDVEMTLDDHSYSSLRDDDASGQLNSSSIEKKKNIPKGKENTKSVSTNRRQRISDMTSEIKNMNDETLSVLKSMDNNLVNINSNLNAINKTLNIMSESLLKIIKEKL